MAIHLRGLPGDIGRAARPTFGLAPGGVYQADQVTPAAGALLPHRFTLACARRTVPSAVCFLWHFPAGRPDWPLASTLPYGAPTFLSRLRRRNAAPAAAIRPTHHHRSHCRTCSSDQPARPRSRFSGEDPTRAWCACPARYDECLYIEKLSARVSILVTASLLS